MGDEKSKWLERKIGAITAVVVALTALIAVVIPFYDQARGLGCRIMPSWCTKGEGEECSVELPLSEYLACQRKNHFE